MTSIRPGFDHQNLVRTRHRGSFRRRSDAGGGRSAARGCRADDRARADTTGFTPALLQLYTRADKSGFAVCLHQITRALHQRRRRCFTPPALPSPRCRARNLSLSQREAENIRAAGRRRCFSLAPSASLPLSLPVSLALSRLRVSLPHRGPSDSGSPGPRLATSHPARSRASLPRARTASPTARRADSGRGNCPTRGPGSAHLNSALGPARRDGAARGATRRQGMTRMPRPSRDRHLEGCAI